MQTKKEEIRARILNAAREEFEAKGYERSSIRTITANAKTSKSNVYNYFPDKEALFAAVVEPTLVALQNGLAAIRARNSGASAYSAEAQREVIVGVMRFVYEREADLKLLLFRSSGSALSDFKERVTGSLSALLADWVAVAAPGRQIDAFFVRMVAGFYAGSIERMLTDGMPKEQAGEHLEAFLAFVYGGWSAVLGRARMMEHGGLQPE